MLPRFTGFAESVWPSAKARAPVGVWCITHLRLCRLRNDDTAGEATHLSDFNRVCLRNVFRLNPRAGLAAETIRRVIVDHACSLHPRIDNDRTDEFESALLKLFRKSL